jgi:hypothetical protein
MYDPENRKTAVRVRAVLGLRGCLDDRFVRIGFVGGRKNLQSSWLSRRGLWMFAEYPADRRSEIFLLDGFQKKTGFHRVIDGTLLGFTRLFLVAGAEQRGDRTCLRMRVDQNQCNDQSVDTQRLNHSKADQHCNGYLT